MQINTWEMALLAKEKKSLEILRKWTFLNIFVCIKNVDIKFGVHDTFLE